MARRVFLKSPTLMKFRIVVVFFLVILFQSFAVFAHAGEPRLEISVELINPGGVVDVRGVDFEREEAVTLMLVNAQTAISLGEIIADVEGVFLQTIVLPVELAEGTYNFLAITDDHNITSPDFTVQGSPILAEGQGEEERRDEEEPLLAPVPTYPPGVVPGVAPGATQPVAAELEYPGMNKPMIAITMIVLIMSVALFIFRLGKR